MTGFVRGTQNDVLNALGRRFIDPLYRDQATQQATWAAMCEIQDGGWLVKVQDIVFEVVEEPTTVEQDVYGCDKGRACTDVADELRPRLEELIKARLADSSRADDRRFHWFWRLDQNVFDLRDVRMFVMETLGSHVVADAAVTLVGNAKTYSRHYEIDMHVTLLPDRMRIRVDDDGPQFRLDDDHVKPAPLEPGENGAPRGGLAIIDEQALSWDVIGSPEHGWSVWADFARSSEETEHLAANFRTVRAGEIPARAYVYRGDDQLAWVPVVTVETSGDRVHPNALDGYPLPSFGVNDEVPIFASDAVMSP
ncbi:hypothetical protein [Catenulispora subtropica]|uniref:Uncharacterized protein n=1 Tax=Catenulispora subtropica TaxID=450798 RepID=A0ABP5CJD1_9ACTN